MDKQAIIDRNKEQLDLISLPELMAYWGDDCLHAPTILTCVADKIRDSLFKPVSLDKEQRHYISLALSVLTTYSPKSANIDLARSINASLFAEDR